MHVVLHYLAAWGAPTPLMEQLQQGGRTRSRPLLLALTWLVSHCRLFERALDGMQLPPDMCAGLPPYPQVCAPPSHRLPAIPQHGPRHMGACGRLGLCAV